MNKSFILLVLALFCAMSFAERTSFRMPKNVIVLDEAQDNNLAKLNLGNLTPHFGMSGGSTGRGIGGTFNGGVTGPLNNHGATWNLGGHYTHTPGGQPGWGVRGGISIPF